jgi:hypothetical protein
VVRERGLEPPQPFGHYHLKVARLPIPPLAQIFGIFGSRNYYNRTWSRFQMLFCIWPSTPPQLGGICLPCFRPCKQPTGCFHLHNLSATTTSTKRVYQFRHSRGNFDGGEQYITCFFNLTQVIVVVQYIEYTSLSILALNSLGVK